MKVQYGTTITNVVHIRFFANLDYSKLTVCYLTLKLDPLMTMIMAALITLPVLLAELKSAMEVYLNDYGKHLPDVVKSKSSYENYRSIMLKVLECKRSEDDKPLDAAAAKILADELYNAGGSRSLGESAVITASPPHHLTSVLFSLSVLKINFVTSYVTFRNF